MPRKVNYGVDYDDDYGDSGEFGDDYEYKDDYEELLEEDETKFVSGSAAAVHKTSGNLNLELIMLSFSMVVDVQKKGKSHALFLVLNFFFTWAEALFMLNFKHNIQLHVKQTYGIPEIKTKQELFRKEVWLCPICAFDNEDSMSSCYICGVIRNPLRKINSSSCIAEDLISTEKEIKTQSKLAAKGMDTSSALASKGRFSGVNEKQSASGSGNYPNISFSSKNVATLSSESGTTNLINEQTVASIPEYKPETWMIPDKVDNGLSQLNLAIVGHVDSGKSTLSGRLLHLLGQISQKEMHKYEMEAKQQGKGSFAYAWALDESVEERERGITMTVGVAFFKSKRYRVVLLDSPGHRDFVPNMISGATQADAAVLVVDASMGSFEAGLDANGGQTREHAQLIRSFGVDQMIVAVNKMDVVQYSKERFDVVKHKLGTVLRSCGFKDSSISWIPLSAMENQNLVANPSDVRFSWFKGHFLLDAIDSLQLPSRDYFKPLVMPICDVMKSQSQGLVSAGGKLESGAIRTSFKVLVMPSRKLATVRSLEHNSQVRDVARAGDNVTVNLHGIEGNRVAAGGVICHPDFPVPVANHLELKILVLDISTPILIGSQLEIHIHHAKEAARVVKILTLLDPKTGKEKKKSPRCLLAKQNAIVEVFLQESICVDEYSNHRALGRVSLRALGRTIALGVVTRIIKREE